jgi:hypothetical protein
MMVEITGSPRAGKSTILKQCCKQLGPDVILFSDDLVLDHYRFNVMANPYVRRFLKDALLLSISLPHLNKYKPFILFAANTLRKTHEPNFTKINIFRNILLKIARFEFIRKNLNHRIVIVDEGLSHIPFNLIDYADDEYLSRAEESLHCTLRMIEGPLKSIHVIVVVRERSDIMVFLLKSGHKRINGRTPYTIKQFNTFNYRLSEQYADVNDAYFRSKNIFQVVTDEPSKATERFACLLKEVARI